MRLRETLHFSRGREKPVPSLRDSEPVRSLPSADAPGYDYVALRARVVARFYLHPIDTLKAKSGQLARRAFQDQAYRGKFSHRQPTKNSLQEIS